MACANDKLFRFKVRVIGSPFEVLPVPKVTKVTGVSLGQDGTVEIPEYNKDIWLADAAFFHIQDNKWIAKNNFENAKNEVLSLSQQLIAEIYNFQSLIGKFPDEKQIDLNEFKIPKLPEKIES